MEEKLVLFVADVKHYVIRMPLVTLRSNSLLSMVLVHG